MGHVYEKFKKQVLFCFIDFNNGLVFNECHCCSK